MLKELSNILIFVVASVGCAKPSGDQALIEIAERFVSDAARYGVTVDINDYTLKFVEALRPMPGKNIIGECFNYKNEVHIKKRWFDRASEADREALLYHELGHCVLRRGHKEGAAGPGGSPTSVMQALLISGVVWEKNREWYLQELFTHDD